jgi:DNA mismatch endonuclease, patch repair protein
MADILTPTQRSKCMRAIRSTNTSPEIRVRSLVHAMGYRFRLHSSALPGKPDLVFPRLRSIIFVHGCFWHQHVCGDGHIPESRKTYWKTKLARNLYRDQIHIRKLRKLGWRVLTIWECQTLNQSRLHKIIYTFLSTAECIEMP